MTNSPETLDEVIFRFHQAVDEVTPQILKEWTSRYPQFAKEIRSHAVEIADMELLATVRTKAAAKVVTSPMPTLRAVLQDAGTSLRDFRASGRLGCAHCYAAFEHSLRELLRRVHGSTRHEGWRHEARDADLMSREVTLQELREKLQRAVAEEAFEVAASLRDQIRGLE